jgi:hypothetical protein
MKTTEIWRYLLKKEFGNNLNVDSMQIAIVNYTANKSPHVFWVLEEINRDNSLDTKVKLTFACAFGMLVGIRIWQLCGCDMKNTELLWLSLLKEEFGTNVNNRGMLMWIKNYTTNKSSQRVWEELMYINHDKYTRGKLTSACALGMFVGIEFGQEYPEGYEAGEY